LPLRGSPERNKIEADRKRGIAAAQQKELEKIRTGEKGSGVWTAEELEEIRKTGRFPADVQWHHEPTVANDPSRAADPNAVRPIRGGRKAHLEEGHSGDWRN
jgi:hypothetical protein